MGDGAAPAPHLVGARTVRRAAARQHAVGEVILLLAGAGGECGRVVRMEGSAAGPPGRQRSSGCCFAARGGCGCGCQVYSKLPCKASWIRDCTVSWIQGIGFLRSKVPVRHQIAAPK